MKLAAISVDLDSLPHYCRIHGLSESLLDDRARHLIYSTAVPRFRELFEEVGVAGTFFVIGEDLEDADARGAVKQAHNAGVEIANHSYSHDYALARRSLKDAREEVRRGAEVIQAACGQTPAGFRAPGYTLSATLYRALMEEGVLYDSSTFPAVPYYAAKAAVMAGLRLLGKPSRSVLDSPRVLAAPTVPYRPDPDQPYRRGTGSVVELPMAVSPLLRLPFIGTFATVMPMQLVKATYATLSGSEVFNFELHGADVIDGADGVPRELLDRQRDLRISAAAKMDRLADVFRWLKRDFDVVSLRTIAERVNV